MGKLTAKELQGVQELFDNDWAETIYGGNIHSYIKEFEEIKDMTEAELRAKYPTAFYWFDKWGVKLKK